MLGATRRNGDPPATRVPAVPRPPMAGIGRYDPWSEFNRMCADMDRFFGGLLGPALPRTEEFSGYTPPVDLYETAQEVALNVYLPGMTQEDIQLEVTGDIIHIAGECKPTVPDKTTAVYQLQGGYGRFAVRYFLPVEVKPEQVKATYRNGVLEVRLPKVEAAKPKSIAVHVAG
jgi:HSP20 family protein